MKCIYCSSQTSITNSRLFRKGFEKWRRHKCSSCSKVFTTRELPDLESSIQVVKRSGKLQPFYINKLVISLYKAIDHRTNSQVEAGAIAQTIYVELLPNPQGTIKSEQIAELAIKTLKNYDPVGAVKYQASLTPNMNKRDIRRAIK